MRKEEKEAERAKNSTLAKKWMLLEPADHPSPEKLASIFAGKFRTETKIGKKKTEPPKT